VPICFADLHFCPLCLQNPSRAKYCSSWARKRWLDCFHFHQSCLLVGISAYSSYLNLSASTQSGFMPSRFMIARLWYSAAICIEQHAVVQKRPHCYAIPQFCITRKQAENILMWGTMLHQNSYAANTSNAPCRARESACKCSGAPIANFQANEHNKVAGMIVQ
jgi:hypothetical protein